MDTFQSAMHTPRFIEIAGLPAAGKTSMSAMLVAWLIEHGMTAVAIPEPGPMSRLQDAKRDWEFNAWTLCRTVESILTYDTLSCADFIVLDRGLVDAITWIEWFGGNGRIDTESAGRLRAFAQVRRWFELQICTIVLVDEIETALTRRRQAPGRIVNVETFAALRQAYERVAHQFLVERPNYPVHVLSTDNRAQREVRDCILALIGGADPVIALRLNDGRS